MSVAKPEFPTAVSNAVASARLSQQEWGMIAFLLSEVAFFSTLIVTYLAYMGKDPPGSEPGSIAPTARWASTR